MGRERLSDEEVLGAFFPFNMVFLRIVLSRFDGVCVFFCVYMCVCLFVFVVTASSIALRF